MAKVMMMNLVISVSAGTYSGTFDGASMMLVIQDNGKGDDDEFGDFCFRWYTLWYIWWCQYDARRSR